jgi:hypothetical protein
MKVSDLGYSYYNNKNKDKYNDSVERFDCAFNDDRVFINNALKSATEDDSTTMIFIDKTNNNIVGFCSYCCSALKNIENVLPAVEIKTFGVDKNYQNKTFDDGNRDLISAYILGYCVSEIEKLSRNLICARFIVLCSHEEAKSFYERNSFSEFNDFHEVLEGTNTLVKGYYMLRYIKRKTK